MSYLILILSTTKSKSPFNPGSAILVKWRLIEVQLSLLKVQHFPFASRTKNRTIIIQKNCIFHSIISIESNVIKNRTLTVQKEFDHLLKTL